MSNRAALQVLNKVDPPTIEPLLPKDYNPNDSTLTRLQAAKIAAETHRRARYSIQNIIQPGMFLHEIASHIETCTQTLIGQGYNKGIGFPTGLSLNNCAAHDTPNPKSHPVALSAEDVLKVDIGTHVDGYIIDSAFTVSFNPQWNNLLLSARDSVYEALKYAGPEASLQEIGERIEEVIRSYEVEVNGRSIPIRPVSNLNGHSINRYKIHGGKYVPIVKNSGNKDRMKEGEFFAIETFTSTGDGYVKEKGDCSHYMITGNRISSPLDGVMKLSEYIKKHFHTLPFCKRYIDPEFKCLDVYMKQLEKVNGVEPYPPLVDAQGSMVAQFEHTIYVTDNGIDVFSKGDDY
ncbi:methionyl aminopeptidase [Nematocida sp. LUAm3]|nr:methionyl aminopeptidase [Nematocida sp. LUAm3]KAI5174555.1 methionyl aminopeptidase [Nematocida sp. LUAm2]KAI5178039.1 methionyl aminopeptidase [Nematocida sp. LUAm1]